MGLCGVDLFVLISDSPFDQLNVIFNMIGSPTQIEIDKATPECSHCYSLLCLHLSKNSDLCLVLPLRTCLLVSDCAHTETLYITLVILKTSGSRRRR